jgi:hypothetical protein
MPFNRYLNKVIRSEHLQADSVTNAKVAADSIGNTETDANQPKHLVFLYDFSVSGGAASAVTLNDAAGVAQTIPGNAIITNVVYEEITALASSGSATVALGILGNVDSFIAATAFDNAAFTADISAKNNEVPFKTGAAPVAVLATIATAALTAGKFKLYVEYKEGTA